MKGLGADTTGEDVGVLLAAAADTRGTVVTV